MPGCIKEPKEAIPKGSLEVAVMVNSPGFFKKDARAAALVSVRRCLTCPMLLFSSDVAMAINTSPLWPICLLAKARRCAKRLFSVNVIFAPLMVPCNKNACIAWASIRITNSEIFFSGSIKSKDACNAA